MSVDAAWFTACGTPLREDERVAATAYLAALGLTPAPVDGVEGWRAAAAIAQREDWSREWWEAEEMERTTLYRDAAATLGEATLLARLSRAMTDTAEPIQAAEAAGRGVEHGFVIKHGLYRGGRWLLGIVGERCFVL